MSNITLEDIYALFQRSQEEADRRAAEADLRSADFDRRMAESKAEDDRRAAEWREEFERSKAEFDLRSADFDRRMAESKAEDDRRAAEWREKFERSKADFDRRMAESKAEDDRRAAEWREEFERSKAEFDRRMAKSERIAAQANQAVNNLTSRWGRFVENLVAPGVLRLFQERGIELDFVAQRFRSPRSGPRFEVDVFAANHDVAAIIEVKSRLTQESVVQVLRTLERFKQVFPFYANHRLYGAVAAIEIDGDVDTYAENQGLFVIQQSGDSVCISSPPDFQPRIW